MKLEQRTLENGVIVMELEGEADLAAAPELQAAVRGVMEQKPRLFIIDFAQATFVNTPIWAVLVEYYQFANAQSLGFAVSGLAGRVAASFEIVKLDSFIPSYPTIEAAATT